MTTAEHLRSQARSCHALGSPMYGALLEHLAGDVDGGGPTARVLAGHEADPGPSALGLRLLGSLHRLVLSGRAPELAGLYPSTGGTWHREAGPTAVVRYLRDHPGPVREWLAHPPQTNEVGRAAALMGALLHLPEEFRLPVHLLELGASGGLNLLMDRFEYVDSEGQRFGAAGSPVRLEPVWDPANLAPWTDLRVVSGRGCDLHPLPVGTAEGRLRATAYVWPDQAQRLDRLRGALDLAAVHPPEVVQASAEDFLTGAHLRPGALTVIWHSVMWQYLPAPVQRAVDQQIERLAGEAGADAPLAHVRLEPARRTPGATHEFLVQLTSWPTGGTRILGTSAPHGLPVRWERSG